MLQPDSALRNEWFPVMIAERLGAQPQSVEVLGVRLAVFRLGDKVRAFRDLCIHRGVPLSMGRVEDGRLVCAYHGWSYDECGRCVRIPAQPANKAIPEKAKAETFRCTEREGLIWVSLGDPSGPPVSLGEFESAVFRKVHCHPYPVQAAGPRVVENFLDVSHLMFVHEGLLGDPESAEIHDHRVRRENGVLVSDEIQVYQPDGDGTGKGVVNRYIYKVLRPFTAWLEKRDSANPDHAFGLMLTVNPHSERHCTAFVVIYRNYDLDQPDDTFSSFQDRLIEQDKAIVEAQKPELLPLDLQAELHLVSDRIAIAYRQWLRELGVSFGTA